METSRRSRMEKWIENQDWDDWLAPPGYGCPSCGEREMDSLVWDEDGETITCSSCGVGYEP